MAGAAGVSVRPAVGEAGGPGAEPASEETLVSADRLSILTATPTPALMVQETSI